MFRKLSTFCPFFLGLLTPFLFQVPFFLFSYKEDGDFILSSQAINFPRLRENKFGKEIIVSANLYIVNTQHPSLCIALLTPYVTKVHLKYSSNLTTEDLVVEFKDPSSYLPIRQLVQILQTQSFHSIQSHETSLLRIHRNKGTYKEAFLPKNIVGSKNYNDDSQYKALYNWFNSLKKNLKIFSTHFSSEDKSSQKLLRFNQTSIFLTGHSDFLFRDRSEAFNQDIRRVSTDDNLEGWMSYNYNSGVDLTLFSKNKIIRAHKDLSVKYILLKRPFVDESPKIHLIIPLMSKSDYTSFYVTNLIRQANRALNLELHFIVLYSFSQSFSVSSYYTNSSLYFDYPTNASKSFFSLLNFVKTQLNDDKALICMGEPSMKLSEEYLHRVRMNTIFKTQVFSPTPFIEYQKEYRERNEKGRFDLRNNKHLGIYSGDIEDFQRGKLYNLKAPDPMLIVKNPSISFLGKRSRLSSLILEYENRKNGRSEYSKMWT